MSFVAIRPKFRQRPAGGGALSFSWQSGNFVGSDPAPSATMFPGQGIGVAGPTRVVVVAISWKAAADDPRADIPSGGVTIGGITATQAVNARTLRGTAIFYAAVPTGTTATIGITGYTAGWINEILINVATLTGSATASVANTNATGVYPNGLTVTLKNRLATAARLLPFGQGQLRITIHGMAIILVTLDRWLTSRLPRPFTKHRLPAAGLPDG